MRARALAVLALGAALIGAVYLVFFTGDDRREIEVVLANASGLRVNSDVRIAGVPAGSVRSIEVNEDDNAVARIAVERSAGRVTTAARAMVKPANLLGEKYIELDLGEGEEELPDGGSIPLERTSTPVELDDVLNVLDAPTRAMLDAAVNAFGRGLGGRGLRLRDLIATMPDSLEESRRLVASLAEDTDAVRELVRATDRVLAAIGPRDEDLGRLVERAAGALESVARRRAALGETVRGAPDAMRRLRGSLARVDSAAAELAPTAAALESTAGPLAETLSELPGFVDAAVPTLGKAQQAAGDLERLARRVDPLVDELRPFSGSLSRATRRLAPIVTFLDTGGIELLLRVLEGWAQAIQVRDGLGHLFRNQLVLSENVVEGLLSRYVSPDGSLRLSPNRRGRRASAPGPASAAGRSADPAQALDLPPVSVPDERRGSGEKAGGRPAAEGGGSSRGGGGSSRDPGGVRGLGDLLDFLLG